MSPGIEARVPHARASTPQRRVPQSYDDWAGGPTRDFPGGAAVAAALTLIAALVTSQVNTGMKFIVLVFILLPVAAMALPLSYFLRWVVEKHGRALHLNSRNLRIAGLVLLVIAVGAIFGYFMKGSGRAVEATRFIHEFLQDLSTEKNPLAAVAGVPERAVACG